MSLDRITRLAADVVASLHEARVTVEPIRLKYVNLGDFGGTNPVQDSWVLEVAGPFDAMQALIPTLKKFGLKWNPQSRSWRLDATLYKYGNARLQSLWDAARKSMVQGYPIIKKMVDEYNAHASSSSGPTLTVQDLMKDIQHKERQISRLTDFGLKVQFEWPDRYSVAEAKTWVLGNTFPVKGVMSHYGFKFTSGKFGKGWWLPTVEFHAVGDKWANDIIKGMPAKQAPTGRAVFTEMSMSELVKYLVPVVEQDMEDNEHYDGEVSSREVLQGYIKRLRAMSPQAQQDFYDRWAKGHRRA